MITRGLDPNAYAEAFHMFDVLSVDGEVYGLSAELPTEIDNNGATYSTEVLIAYGHSAKILIKGAVTTDAIVICIGDDAEIEIWGGVHRNARVIASGRNAHVLVDGMVSEGAKVLAVGEGSEVLTGHTSEVVDIRGSLT